MVLVFFLFLLLFTLSSSSLHLLFLFDDDLRFHAPLIVCLFVIAAYAVFDVVDDTTV